ncbi:MAG: hypothetical protein ABFS45_10240 [Pseudomonadota bacterium]
MTYMIGQLGVQLPKVLLPPINDNNERGFWESLHLLAIHEELLKNAGTVWSDFHAFPEQWYKATEADQYKKKIVELLKKDFSDTQTFVIKDPRVCRLVPFWRDVLMEFGAEPSFILPLRNPLEVAASLKMRDGIPVGKGLLIWLRHVLDAERFSRCCKRSFVTYEGLLKDWKKTAEKIAKDLQFDWPVPYSAVMHQLDEFISPGYRHHRSAEIELTTDSGVSIWMAESFKALKRAAEGDESELVNVLNGVSNCFDKACNMVDELSDSASQEYEWKLEVTQSRLKDEQENAQAQIKYRDRLVAELKQQLEQEKNNARLQIQYRDELVAQYKEQIEHQDAMITNHRKQFESIMNSPLRLVKRFGHTLFHRVLKKGQ